MEEDKTWETLSDKEFEEKQKYIEVLKLIGVIADVKGRKLE